MIVVRTRGDLRKTTKFLKTLSDNWYEKILEYYAKKGQDALERATPVETGKTAASWGYQIYRNGDSVTIAWTNSNVNKGVPIAIILQYGHGTPTGGWVEGRDYINPAIQPIFDEMAKTLWKEVTSA